MYNSSAIYFCPDGGIGIRARLKIVSRKGCGFDPHSGHHASLAQLVEQIPLKDKVEGSIPSGRTKCKGTTIQ